MNSMREVSSLEVGTAKEMEDGTTAYLTLSKHYFVRREPKADKWTRIKYYSLDGEKVQLAKGKCKSCQQIIESKHCGDYVSCGCGKSFVDTDRWFPERHRFGGEVEPLSYELEM